MNDLARMFLDAARRSLRGEYLPKIEHCLAALGEEDVWWRPNEASNSIGNLLLHLDGNARQWIVSGVGGAPDVRTRQQEFNERAPLPAARLLAQWTATLEAVDQVLAALDPARLHEPRRIQGQDVTVFGAIYHVVEHVALHTGQIIYITKLRTGRDLGFYAVQDGVARPRWSHPPSS